MDFNQEELMKVPHFNEETIGNLKARTVNNPEILKDIFQSYIDDTNQLLSEIKISIQEDKIDDYYRAIHTYKGLAATIGCTRIFHLLKVMDSLNKEKNFERSKELFSHLTGIHKELSALIKKEML